MGFWGTVPGGGAAYPATIYDFEGTVSAIDADFGNSFASGDWKKNTTIVNTGSESLENQTTGDTFWSAESEGTLSEYFEQGQTWSIFVHANGAWGDSGLVFRGGVGGSTFAATTDESLPEINILDDTNSQVADAAITLSNYDNEWCEIRVTDDDGSLGGTANDITMKFIDSNGTTQATAIGNSSRQNTDNGVGIENTGAVRGDIFDTLQRYE